MKQPKGNVQWISILKSCKYSFQYLIINICVLYVILNKMLLNILKYYRTKYKYYFSHICHSTNCENIFQYSCYNSVTWNSVFVLCKSLVGQTNVIASGRNSLHKTLRHIILVNMSSIVIIYATQLIENHWLSLLMFSVWLGYRSKPVSPHSRPAR